MTQSLRDHCERRLSSMKGVRTDYEEEWRDIARFAQPARSRFLAADRDKGATRRVRNKRLFDPHGIEAFRTLTNGMTSGLTSASRPWFTLRLPDEELNEQPEVRTWLSEVEESMYAFLASTNFYGAAKSGYGEMGLFGTEACVMAEHRTRGAVCHSLTAGEYWIALSDAMTPDTLLRVCPLTPRQVVQTLLKNTPEHIRKRYDEGDSDGTVELYQLIEPNHDHDQERFGSKPWRSIWWDPHCDKSRDDYGILKSSAGYEEQPFWAPRWDVVGGDTYGVSPGMECLPALRELQMQAKRRNEAVDFMVHPEKVVKAGMRLTGEPRRVVSAASFDKDSVLVPYQMPYQAVDAIENSIQNCRLQIDGLSYADLFNAITNMRGIQPRNVEEIASRNEEKLTQLGPVIERVSNEKLEIAIDRTFGIMARGGLLRPAPEPLAGMKIDVEFVSILTQMQRAVGVGQIERTVAFVGNIAAAQPTVLDKLDTDELVDEYASRAGVPPSVIRSDKEVEQIRAQRAAQENAATAAGMMAPVKDGAQAARLLSETDVGGKPLLDTLVGT